MKVRKIKNQWMIKKAESRQTSSTRIPQRWPALLGASYNEMHGVNMFYYWWGEPSSLGL